MQLKPETEIKRDGSSIVMGNRDTLHLSKSLANIMGMHFDADHVICVYAEMVEYWVNKKSELSHKSAEASSKEKKNVRYQINKVDEQIKKLKQHITNVDTFAEDFKRIFVKSGCESPEEGREEAYHNLLDQFYTITKLQAQLLQSYTHVYFTADIDTVFVPALLVRTETPTVGESLRIGECFYSVKIDGDNKVEHYKRGKKRLQINSKDDEQQ